MRITTRLTLTLTLIALVVLGGFGVFAARRSQQELEHTVERKTRLITHALLAGVEHDLRDGSWDDVRDTVRRIGDEDFVVRIIDAHGDVRASSSSLDPDRAEQTSITDAMEGHETFVIRRDEDPLRAIHVAPLADGHGRLLGAVCVTQRLVGMSASIADTRRDAAIAVAAFVLAAAAAASWMGRVHVGLPIARLVGAMRRVRSGHLAGVGARERTTELVELGREFDLMVAQLVTARRDLVDAESGRVELERRLQRADKLIALGQLAAGVAHEIGSPLQVLVGRARALASRDYDGSAVQRHAAIIAEQGERIAGIVERLLGYARRHPERHVLTHVDRAAASVVDLLSSEAERRRITLRFESSEEDLEVLSPPGQLQQITLNLALNALESTPRGGEVSVCVRAAGPASARGVEIEVADDGRGIPEDQRERVFDAFFTTRSSEGGTGLGLSVVRSLVRELGGRIELDSAVGRGTRIVVWLPASREATS